MEPDGTVDIDDFMFKAFVNDTIVFDLDDIKRIVKEDDKQRYKIIGNRIKAVQGHSVDFVNLNLKPIKPPALLYHGTVEKFMESIQKQGILSQSRQFVHLSRVEKVAEQVASRRAGKQFILRIHAKKMYNDGFKFYQAENGVWLTHKVPVEYFDILEV